MKRLNLEVGRRAALVAVLSIALAVLVSACGSQADDASDAVKTGNSVAQDWRLPPTPLQDIATGQRVRLDRIQSPMLINFWASWCHPCLQEIPTLEALHQSADLPVTIVGVAMDSGNRAAVRTFAKAHDMHYRLLLATSDDLDSRYNLLGLPITLLVDRHGVVRQRLVGAQTAPAFRAAIQALIAADRQRP